MPGTVIAGSVSVEVDPQEVEAKIRFVPSPGGDNWNAERVLQLIAGNHIVPQPSARAIEELLGKFAKVKDPASAVIARGVPPEEPLGERVTWADLPIPEELVEPARELMLRAKLPEIFRVRVEKVKRETIVKKPAPLPFLPPKEEVVVTYDKKEIREAVIVNPTVQDQLYAEKGQKIGTLAAPKPGKPGKDIHGKPIPAPIVADPSFLLGNGIERDKNELRTTATGVVRVGSGWADVLPLAKSKWRVEKGSDGVTVYLWFEPGIKSLPPPSAVDVISAAASLGVSEEMLRPAPEIEEALLDAVRGGEPLEAFCLSLTRDGDVRVDISPDGIKAALTMRKAVGGGRPLELKTVAEAIKASKVRGFAAEKVKADILAFFKGPELELSDYVLFEGRAPTRGKDREIQAAVAFLNDQLRDELLERVVSSPRSGLPTEPDDFFPPKEASHVAFVEKDALVAAVTQPPSGIAGVDVFGAAIPGLPGNDPDIKPLIGLRMSRHELRSDYSGLLLAKKEGAAFTAYVLPYRDAKISVEISEDSLSASVTLEKEEGAGPALNAEAVAKALTDAWVTRGIDNQAVAAALSEALETGRCGPVVVARGELPVAGGANSVRWLIRQPSGKNVTLRDGGAADYKNQDKLVSVSEGMPIVEIVRQGAAGRAGFTVTGKVLDPEMGESVTIVHDDTVREEPIDGGVRLVAARTGEVDFDGRSLRVNALYNVRGDVGLATGNINFPGEVRVSGSVKPGFAVVGGGDVSVGEAAEAALVSSGGKAVIGQGVIGAGKGVVRARRGIDAAFVEQATLLAVEDIRIKSGCLQCQVKTNGKLRLMGEKGHLIGGVCRARLGVDAVNVGSERGTRTEISFGQDYLVKDQIESIEREIDKMKAALVELEKRIKAMEASGANLDSIRTEKVRFMKQMEKLSLKLFTLREKFEEHNESEVRVRGSVFPGVVMESHGRYFEVKQKKAMVIFYFDREVGRIQEKPLT